MKSNQRRERRPVSGFSLVEVLAAVTIIGIIAFLAVPNIVRIKEDSETNLAIARAEALNMGITSFIQANGKDLAVSEWGDASSNQGRYDLVAAYLAFAPAAVTDYMPTGYTVTLPADISTLTKTELQDADGNDISY